ncbi:MAG: NAD(P)/FAD-dependent oxidoreductase, partial [Nitrospiraceae bacterium]
VPLTPVAMREGVIAANNILHGLDRRRPDYRAVPSVVFTLPKLASAGLQESEARDAGRDIEVRFKDTSGWLHNQRMNEGFTGSKIILEKKTRAILGAHILDSHADDLINVFALAMEQGLTAEKIRDVLYAYPTATSSIQYMV